MLNRKSMYAINKEDPDAIIYMDAEGNTIRLSKADFANEEEFLKWKEWSDTEYHDAETEQHRYDNHTISTDTLLNHTTSTPAVDTTLEQIWNDVDKFNSNAAMITEIKKVLTKTQFRRIWMYHANGMTLQEIAGKEKVSFQCVHKSIRIAEKKICELFENYSDSVPN